jgi:cystathionine gamma-lyase
MPEPGDGTRVVRAGLPPAGQGEPLRPGPVLAAPFHLRGEPQTSPYVYGRYGTPTWTAYEAAVGELEGGPAVLFASGMAAVAAVMLRCLGPGDVLVAPSGAYIWTRGLAQGHLAERGVEVRLVPTAGPKAVEAIEGAALVWLETPSNPGLDVCDVAALAALAHRAGALVAVDNTSATPLGQRPLELGADFSVVSVTKHLSGHSDLLLGYVAVSDPAQAEALVEWRKATGGIAGPFEAWLAHRSLPTLALRLERQCANAQAIAELLSARADAASVRYPGLSDDPAHPLAARQMRSYGTVLSFDAGSRARAEGFLAAAELVDEATSFGGVQTSAERRARWRSDAVPAGFVRLSAGCEDTADLVADVGRALDAAG